MAVRLSQLRKSYPTPDGGTALIINIAEFELGDGEQIALSGTSGLGKTTLLHLLAGIVTPDAGSIRHTGGDGREIELTTLSEAQRDGFRGRHMGYVFQTHHLLPGFTAWENVRLGMSFAGRKPDPAWAEHLLEEVGLGGRLHYLPEKLSVGQRQRVAVARALANRPQLVLADEPTGSLDAANARQVMELMRRLCAEVKAALLVVSHDPAVTSAMPRVVALGDLNQIPAG